MAENKNKNVIEFLTGVYHNCCALLDDYYDDRAEDGADGCRSQKIMLKQTIDYYIVNELGGKAIKDD